MRNAIRILVLVLIAAGVYAYYQIPSTSDKELDAALAEISAATSNTPQSAAGPPVTPAPPPTHAVAAAPAQPKPPAPVSAPTPVSIPPPPPLKPWTPPDVMPAQPNWTWTTTDGTTYNNVVVTKLGPETVSFTHAMGVAHDVPIANLPPDIQRRLNYDPAAAAAARKESDRERAHPYYAFADLANAQFVARQLHWPLAWLSTSLAMLSVANPEPDSQTDFSQRAVTHLKSHAIIVLLDGSGDVDKLPPLIHGQFFITDDGPIPGGHHFYGPKIVFSDPDITRTYGRISYTALKARGDAAFDEGITTITGPTIASATNSPGQTFPPPTPAEAPLGSQPAAARTADLPPLSSFKPWTPPDVLPAQPNWTWTTTEGTTYNHVVVTKLGPDTVSFTHAMGVAHDVPIANLPPDIQRRLNYDPTAAAAARKEADRERAHPYYAFADLAAAQTVARQMRWPLAWMCTDLAALSFVNPPPDSEQDLAQRAVSHLKSHAIILLVNGNGELVKLPPLILNQFFVLDDGPIPGGHHFYGPKIVLSDADITKTYGRITHTQLIAEGDAAFDQGLATIPTGSTVVSAANSPPEKVVKPAPAAVPAPPPAEATPWAPPDVIPAQPNWTWTTMDGTTYQNVVITKIEPETVSITHSLGVAHIPINLLPRDLQKQLNYHRP